MAQIYITKKAFEGLNSDSLEAKILGKQKQIFLDVAKEDLMPMLVQNDDELDFGNPFTDFQMEYSNVSFESGATLFDHIKKNIYDELKNIPHGIFVLDISKTEAQTLTKQYGVLCMSDEDFSFECLSKSHAKYLERQISADCSDESLDKPFDDSPIVMAEVFPEDVILPCNSVIVIDKYLFKDDKQGEIVTEILSHFIKKGMLPNVCEIMFITQLIESTDVTKKKEEFKKLADLVYEKVKCINGVSCRVSLFSGDKSEKLFEDLHNRYIITNYGMVTAEHGLAVCDHSHKGRYDQKITIHNLYSEGIANKADTPEYAQQIIIRRVTNCLKSAINKFDKQEENPTYRFAQSLDTNMRSNPNKIKPSDIKHRFIKINSAAQ